MNIFNKQKHMVIVIIGGVLFIFPSHLHAYLDPGVGSIILQYLVGAVFAAAVAIKLNWHRLLRFFKIEKSEPIVRDHKQKSSGQNHKE